ncbi:MAG TPA: EAL domain-containing protein [Xanthomonadaceae bacterium]|nr:EAL domain-containing protein [Xanthomonadaceae bacterium]
MAPKEDVLRLILIEDSMEEAERLVSILKNGGVAVRPSRPENSEQLQGMLERQSPDLLLLDPNSSVVPADEVINLVRQSAKDISIVGLLEKAHESEILAMYQLGVEVMALRGQEDHLRDVVIREFRILLNRRALRRLEASLRETERRCESLIESSRDPIAYVHEGMHVRANKAYLEMFGYEDFDEIEGMPILDMVDSEHAANFKTLLKELSKGEKPPKNLDLVARRADGATFDATMEFSQASYEGEPCLQIIFRPQSLDPDMARELDALKTRDLVTGLLNRQAMLVELEEAVATAARGEGERALLLIEIDNVRQVLQTVGLGSADILLRDLAETIKRQITAEEHAARFTDQSFTVLCGHASARNVGAIAERIRKAVSDHVFEAGGQSLSINVSIGGVIIGEKIANVQGVLSRATETAHKAFADGGNRIEIFDPSAEDKELVARERQWVANLEKSLAHDGFILYYQPLVNLQGLEGHFYEVLLRLQGPTGEILPGDFLPVAERHGLLPKVDRWVIRHAIRVASEREKAGKKTTLFVKLTLPTIEDPTLLPWVAEKLREARLRGDSLVFQLPEARTQVSIKPVRDFQKGLEKLHCGFCLEQFGSGLTSFQLLKHVDANYLKVDRSFMSDLAKNADSQQRVREICEQAHGLGKQCIAEYVEDANTMAVLFQIGVDFVQGHFLQKPDKAMNYDFGH